MEMQDLIDAIDMSKLSRYDLNLEDFAEEFRISYYSTEWKEDAWDLFTERVQAVPIYTWPCTDTTVGIYSYFLDSELVCLSFQAGRKMDKNFYWLSRETAKSVSDFIETLKDEDANPPISLLSDFNEKYWDWDAIEKAVVSK